MISVVIPVLNEKDNLVLLHNRLTRVLKDIGDTYEIIYVDDASTDGSWEIIKQLRNDNDKVRAIHFTRTFGQKAAVIAGLSKSVGEKVITMDSDLQNPPEEIPKLLDKLDEGYNVVFGIPNEKKHSWYRRWGTAFGKYTMSKLLPSVPSNWSGFRALSRVVVNQLINMSERNIFIDTLLCWMGYKMIAIEVEHRDRNAGKSKYNFFKLMGVYLDLVITLTDIPLRIATFGGLFLGALGFLLVFAYIIMYFVQSYTVPGFITTVILISFFSGIQLFCLGILGEYVGRANNEIRHRPNYIIKEDL